MMLSGFLAQGLMVGAALAVCVGASAQEGVSSSGAVTAKQPTATAVQPGTALVRPASTAAFESQGGSQVRIVRLSQVRGFVQMDRNTGRSFESAFTNIPVVAGAKLLTGQGVAEVEFEDNSSLRLAPGSEAEFVQLGRAADGVTLTTVKLGKGVAYVSMQKGKGAGEFALQYGSARVVMGPGAHVRVDATQPDVELAVFDGSAQVEMGSATTTLGKKQTVTLNPVTQTMAPVQKGIQEVAWDGWDGTQTSYHKNASSFAGAGGGFGLYGVNDLNYYGSFADTGCGSMWRPYFAGSGFDPFGNGIWTYYQGAGYSWVSPYPWGWLPYHSGSWVNCGGSGWGWQPGGSWVGLQNHGLMRIANHPMPHPLPPTPVKGAGTLVPVNTKPLAFSGASGDGKFSFRQGSAGMGVPREGFGKLNGFASNAERHGVATSSSVPSAFVPAGGGAGGSVGSSAGGRSTVAGGARSTTMAGGGRSSSPSSSSASAGGMRSGGGGPMSSGGASSAGSSSGGGASGGAPRGASSAGSSGGGVRR